MRVQYPKCAYGPYCLLNPIKNGVYILVEVSFYIVSFGLNRMKIRTPNSCYRDNTFFLDFRDL